MSQPQRRDAIQCTTLITSYIRRLAGIIKSKAPNLDQKDLGHITAMLREVSRKESILARGKDLIRAHANAYQSLHKKDIRELEKRLRETTDPKKRKLIEEELIYQRRMIQAVDFLDKYETKIQEFIQAFNPLVYAANVMAFLTSVIFTYSRRSHLGFLQLLFRCTSPPISDF